MSTTLQRIAYSPLWLLLHAVALLPFGALYALSDVLAWATAGGWSKPILPQHSPTRRRRNVATS